MEHKKYIKKPTHFVFFPLYYMPAITTNYDKLRSNILSIPGTDVDPHYFQHPMRLHMSTVMLTLDTEEKISKAKDAMKLIESDVKKIITAPFDVTIEHLNVFSQPKATNLLFAETKKDAAYQKLQDIADIAIRRMGEYDLIDEKEYSHIFYNKKTDKNEIKLHMTILNTLFKQDKEKGKKYLFNSLPIIEKYGATELGTGTLDHIELCMKGAHFDSAGHYICIDKFML